MSGGVIGDTGTLNVKFL